MTPHEQFLQRHARLGWLIVGLVIGCGVALVVGAVKIGVDCYKPEPTELRGNTTCTFDANGQAVWCGGVRFVRQ